MAAVLACSDAAIGPVLVFGPVSDQAVRLWVKAIVLASFGPQIQKIYNDSDMRSYYSRTSSASVWTSTKSSLGNLIQWLCVDDSCPSSS